MTNPVPNTTADVALNVALLNEEDRNLQRAARQGNNNCAWCSLALVTGLGVSISAVAGSKVILIASVAAAILAGSIFCVGEFCHRQ